LITAHGPGIATSGNDFVYVLDHGNFNTNPPTYGGDVVEFGPGGTGCPIPDPRFTVNGSTSSTVTVQKGSSVQFLADTSHLNGATATQLEWDLDGSGAFATVAKGPNPILEESYKYLKAGTYTVSMKMQLTGGTVNELPPATKTVTVVPGTPTAAFKASTSSPKPSEEVTFDASSSIDPTGSPTAGPTKELKTYSWDFGDGTKQETTTATTTHAFANTSTTPVNRTVKLTVTSIDNIQSTPVTQTIMVLGIPAPPTPAPITLPPAPLPISTPPAAIPAGPGAASLLTATIKGTSAALTIGCATSPGACEGTLTLTASVPAAKHHGKTQAHARATVIGSTSFTIAAGGRGAVSVKITKAAMALLAKSHRLTVTARIVTHNSAGTQASTSKTVALTQTAKGKTGGKHH
jgi:PKD repeat protein